MITAHALYTDRDRFLTEAASGHAIVVDAGSEKSANSPVELVLIALCACSASDVVSILRKKREPFTSVDVSAEADRSEDFPKVFTSIRVVYRIGRKSDAQGRGRRCPFVEGEVLFGLGHAGEVGQDRFCH